MSSLADRRFEMTLRNRVLVGVGEVARLPELVTASGGAGAFLVTDPGVLAAGVVAPALEAIAMAGIPATVFSDVEPKVCTLELMTRGKTLELDPCTFDMSLGSRRNVQVRVVAAKPGK